MNQVPPETCPHCGRKIREKNAEDSSAQEHGSAPEIDHRGVALPRRTRLGGIIVPQ